MLPIMQFHVALHLQFLSNRRDIITTRGEALAKSKMNIVTKGSLERQVTDLKRRMKQTRQVDLQISVIIYNFGIFS